MSHSDVKHGKSQLGFWLYLMTDCVLFAALFATYIVLQTGTNGGPDASELFSLPFVLIETMLLLASSFTCGLALLAARKQQLNNVYIWLAVTFALGATFLGMELYEFNKLVQEGYGPGFSGFLSAFFTLVGVHGVHITVGLLWIVALVVYMAKRGLNDIAQKRLMLFSLFWHFLDIIWIFIFTIVYLLGVSR